MYYLQEWGRRLGLQLQGQTDLVAAGVEVLTVDGGRQSQRHACNTKYKVLVLIFHRNHHQASWSSIYF